MALLEINSKNYILKKGFHLIGQYKRNADLDITIIDQSVDDKHALLKISSSEVSVIDLNSKNGTFVNSYRIERNRMYTLPKSCLIKFGNTVGILTHSIKEKDSGYLDRGTSSRDYSDIITNSQDHNHHEQLSDDNLDNEKNSITSTPNSVKRFNQKYLSSSPSQFSILNDLKNYSNSNSSNDSNNGSNIIDDTENSLIVPETPTATISMKSTKNISLFSSDDEFLVPETQEICNVLEGIPNSNTNEEFRIATQDFILSEMNDFQISKENLSDFESSSNDSVNLFNGIISQNVPLIKDVVPVPSASTDKMPEIQANLENDDYDAELSTINWNDDNHEISNNNKSSIKTTGSKFTTPESFRQINKEVVKKLNNHHDNLRQGSITPDFIILNKDNNETDGIRSTSVTPDLIISQNLNDTFFQKSTVNNEENTILKLSTAAKNAIKETKQQFEFTAPTTASINVNKTITKIAYVPLDDDSELEPTQILMQPSSISPSKDSDKENSPHKCTKKMENDDDSDSNLEPTQKFQYPNKNIPANIKDNNKYLLNDSDNDDMLEPTQQFFFNSIPNVPQKSLDSKKNLESITTETCARKVIHKRKVTTNQKFVDSESSEDEEINQFKKPYMNNKINHLPSTTSSTKKTISPPPIPEVQKSREEILITPEPDHQILDSQTFDFETCTPQFDFIKPHQSTDIRKFGTSKRVIPKPSKFTLEEISSDDENDNAFEDNGEFCEFLKPPTKNHTIDKKLKLNEMAATITSSSQSQDCKKINNKKESTKVKKIEESSKIKNQKPPLKLIKIEKSSCKKDDDHKKLPDNLFEVPKSSTTNRRQSESRNSSTVTLDTKKLLPSSSTHSSIRKSSRVKPSSQVKNYYSYDLDNLTELLGEMAEKQPPKQINTSRKRAHQQSSEDSKQQNNPKKVNKITELKQLPQPIKKSTRKRESQDDNLPTTSKSIKNESITKNITTKMNANHKIAFTTVDGAIYQPIIEQMGSEIVENVHDATILITTNIARTSKFMVALGLGIPIISDKWLATMRNTKSCSLPYTDYPIQDIAGEKRYNFRLKDTLKKAKIQKIFQNMQFFVTPNTIPLPDELYQMIEVCGGECIKELTTSQRKSNNLFIVSSKIESKICLKLCEFYPDAKVIKAEGILLSIMQQKLCFNLHILKN